MKKYQKISIIVVLLIAIGIVVTFVNSFYGNPVSKLLAKRAAKEYINEHYADQNLHIDKVVYNFKFGNYGAYATSDTSIDTHFTIYVSGMGKIKDDDYDDVASGWNTYMRVEEAYRKLVDSVFSNPKFPLKSDIDYGELMIDEKAENDFDHVQYGIKQSSLKLDKKYDIKELGKTAGHIVYYAKDDVVTLEKASELLLLLKEELDQANVPFYAIDFVLEKPRLDGKPSIDGNRIQVQNFLYRDIKKEGLESRVKKAHEELTAYYKEQDERKSKGY